MQEVERRRLHGVTAADIQLLVLRSSLLLTAEFREPICDRAVVILHQLELRDLAGNAGGWLTYLDVREREIKSYDRPGHQRRPTTDAEMAACRIGIPPFGAIEELVACLNTCLEFTGHASNQVAF